MTEPRVHVIHEHPEWFPVAEQIRAFEAVGVRVPAVERTSSLPRFADTPTGR